MNQQKRIINEFSSVDEIFSKDYTRVVSPYSQIQNGISAEVITLPKEGNDEEIVLSQHMIALFLGKYANMHFVSNNRHYDFPLYKGSLGIVPSQMPMQSRWDRTSSFLYVYIEPWFLSRCSEDIYKETKMVEIIPPIGDSKDDLTLQLCLAIKNELAEKSSLAYLQSISDALASHLLHRYSTHTQPLPIYQGGLAPHKLKPVIELINDNLTQDTSLDDMAKVANLSRSHFSRAFKQSMGISPHQYIIQQRVERAKHLLLQGNMTLVEIAFACGFNHQSHLNRHFKRLTGMSPNFFPSNSIFVQKEH